MLMINSVSSFPLLTEYVKPPIAWLFLYISMEVRDRAYMKGVCVLESKAEESACIFHCETFFTSMALTQVPCHKHSAECTNTNEYILYTNILFLKYK